MSKTSVRIKEGEKESIMKRPLCMLTLEEFLYITGLHNQAKPDNQPIEKEKNVYGLSGLASILGCSVPTASRLKKSGIFDSAISQVNRKIVVDVDKALAIISKETK